MAACDAADDQCLIGCSGTPVGVYLANRTPPSLLVGETSAGVSQYGTDDAVTFHDQIALSQGASRVLIGSIVGPDKKLHSRVFIVCFDARLIYVFDPEAGVIESIVQTGRGPTAIAFEPNLDPAGGGGAYAYVAHFTDSYLGVLDLDMNHTSTYLTFVATVAVPVAPRESK